jgi:hypothetical protein
LIVAAYSDLPVALRAADGPRMTLINATSGPSLVVEVDPDSQIEIQSIVDCRGQPVTGHPRYLRPGLHRLAVPRSGLVELAND